MRVGDGDVRKNAKRREWQRAIVVWCVQQLKMVLSRTSKTSSASAPKPGDRILIFKQQWLQLVLSGQKTMECRGAAYKSGKYYLGCGGPT